LRPQHERVAICAFPKQSADQNFLKENQTMSADSRVATATIVPTWRTWWFKLAGLIPLAFFLIRMIDYVRWGTPAHIWWNCHIANLTLAIGMLLGNLLLIRVAVIWLLLGVPPWAIDMWMTKIIWPIAVLTHLGGALFGLAVLYKVRMARGVWWVALVWFLVLQQLSRFFTPLKFNVNVAHHAYGPLEHWFGSYWQYWLANTAGAALLLWLLEWSLAKVFPVKH
jgi:ABC-type multidrug transport system permease subunit